jgi:hypothetical protein
MVIGRRSLLLAGAAVPAAAASARAQCVTDTPGVDACSGGVRITSPPGVTLDISFGGPTLDPRITFTRASTATYFDATGTMQTATTNAPRFDYDPVTHVARGLLIEEARTNLWLQSADASNAAWQKANITVAAPVVTANQAIAPDGTLTAARVTYPAVSAAGNMSELYQQVTVTAAVYTFSVWLKGNAGGEQLYLYASSGTNYELRVTLTTAWQRFVFVTPALTAAGWFFCIGTDLRDVSQTSTPGGTVFVWGAQLEQGAFATSYIPTTAAAVTRAADAASMPVGAWFNAAQGSLAADTDGPATAAAIAGFSDGSTANMFYFRQVGDVQTAVASVFKGIGVSPWSAYPIGNKIAGSYQSGRLAGASNGGAVAVDATLASGPFLWTTRLSLGCSPWALDSPINGHLRRVRFWPRVLSNSELQSVTR